MITGAGVCRNIDVIDTVQPCRLTKFYMISVVAPEIMPGSVSILQQSFQTYAGKVQLLSRISQNHIREYQHSTGTQDSGCLQKTLAAGGEVKHRLDAENAVDTVCSEGQYAGVSLYPVKTVGVPGDELTADCQLARINVNAGKVHVVVVLVDLLQRTAKAATHIKNMLLMSQIGQERRISLRRA